MAKVLRQLRDHVKGGDTLSTNGTTNIATSRAGQQSKAKADNEAPGIKNETLHGEPVSLVDSVDFSTRTDRLRE